jgi:hypothetical protein
LRVFLASIALNAALAIYALLFQGFGDLQRKILLTSLCVSGSSVLALACGPALKQSRLGRVPIAGAWLSAAGFALVIGAIWNDFEAMVVWKAGFTLVLVAAALALASLLSLCRLAPRFVWAFRAAFALALLLAGTISAGFWNEIGDEWFWRAVGVQSVLLAAITLAVPVLHVASRREAAAGGGDPGPAIEGGCALFCPLCAEPVTGSPDAGSVSECERCGGAFRVSVLRRGHRRAVLAGSVDSENRARARAPVTPRDRAARPR